MDLAELKKLTETPVVVVLLAIAGIAGVIAGLWKFGHTRILKFILQYRAAKWDKRRVEMFKGLINQEYLEWQQETLETLYQGLEFAIVYGHKYPAAIIRPQTVQPYPFADLCTLTDSKLPTLMIDKEQEMYLRILGSSVTKPEMKGFALRKINIDNRSRAGEIEAVTTNCRQNLVTAHILEWELYRFFKSNHWSESYLGEEAILEYLPRRAKYHNARSGRLAILEPASAYPLISVQAMVVFRDTNSSPHTWRIVTAKQSDEVSVKPGYFQFKPAGGFEVYGKETDNDDYLVKTGFNVSTALFREYAEELFDAKHLADKKNECDPNSAVLSEPHVHKLITLINKGKAFIDFLGVVVDLTVLRHELSFLIVIDDAGFCEDPLLGSWEGEHVAVPPCDLQSRLSGGVLHSSSAALLQLAMESDRLRELGVFEEV